ncbi:MAG TPA: redoxin domain-containing protein [Pirellulaceae bacterium]|nr:redoxin domain-containing protein [Pirellulaceae bacterium]
MSKRARYWLIVGLLIGVPHFARAEETPENKAAPAPAAPMPPAAPEIKPGHSAHGEVFDEGPRQAAYVMGNTGKVRFKITTDKPEVQQFFDQGLGQYYGFWYFESERSFRQMVALDHKHAMAYWGLALANFENPGRGRKFMVEAVKYKEGLSEHERLHLEALDAYMKHDDKKGKERGENYARALEKILYKFPDDIEAKALLALQLWRNRSSGSQIQSFLAIDALISEVFVSEPMHPAHHFRIHLWDGERSEKALASAALCGQSAPGIAHMWHMSGHIYSGLKRYEDACYQQEAAARVDHAHMMRDRVLPDQIHNFAHNNEWFIRNLQHVGRAHEALELAKNMSELPRHPKYNSLDKGSNKYGRERLLETLRLFELWDETIALAETPYLEPTDRPADQITRLRYLGMAWFRKGDAAHGQPILSELETRWQNELAARDRAGVEAEQNARKDNKRDKDLEKARDDARRGFNGRIEQLEKTVHELQGYQAALANDFSKAHELLKKSGNAGRLYQALVQFQAGQRDEALKVLEDQVKSNQNEVLPLAAQVELLWKADKKEQAKASLEKLREISGVIDLTAPPLARVTPIAKELGFGDNWVVAKTPASDTGVRPALDSLGPFRWQPSPAAAWSLTDSQGKTVSLAQYQGKPLVLIFYLGHGCLHCAEQLKAFGPKIKDYQAAGIEVVAISSDDAEGLKMSIENYQEPIPFTLVSNEGLDVFKSYRCHDDFENKPLHGTFIIDGAGLLRWQDIGADPFMDADFVLKEAKRLFAQKIVVAPPTAPPLPVTLGAK